MNKAIAKNEIFRMSCAFDFKDFLEVIEEGLSLAADDWSASSEFYDTLKRLSAEVKDARENFRTVDD